MGFAKTSTIAPNGSETVTVTVNKYDLATYDHVVNKGYILEGGSYYLAIGSDTHDALNNILAAKGRAEVSRTLWAVPTAIGSQECPQPGTLERLDYSIHAYVTDGREVQKIAYVYLPYGYRVETQYNILYLLHGTGDDEEYWLKRTTVWTAWTHWLILSKMNCAAFDFGLKSQIDDYTDIALPVALRFALHQAGDDLDLVLLLLLPIPCIAFGLYFLITLAPLAVPAPQFGRWNPPPLGQRSR